jgi:hypothetical protein
LHESSSTHHTAVSQPCWGPVSHPHQRQVCSRACEQISAWSQRLFCCFFTQFHVPNQTSSHHQLIPPIRAHKSSFNMKLLTWDKVWWNSYKSTDIKATILGKGHAVFNVITDLDLCPLSVLNIKTTILNCLFLSSGRQDMETEIQPIPKTLCILYPTYVIDLIFESQPVTKRKESQPITYAHRSTSTVMTS